LINTIILKNKGAEMLKQKQLIALLLYGFLSTAALAQNMAGQTTHTISSSGIERSYVLYIPAVETDANLPLVFNFHGSGSTPQRQEAQTDFIRLADNHGFVLVYPVGAYTNSVTSGSWNANLDAGVDDVQFTRDIIENIASMLNLDRKRIYSTGMSGGGRMTSRLACELSDILAAAAPVAGLQYPNGCTLRRAIPIQSFHSTDDATNQYEVSVNSRPYWSMGVETAIDRWRQANDCSLDNSSDKLSQHVTYYQWSDCGGLAEIQFYQLNNGGHTWPNSPSSSSNKDINASELVWDFFSRHKLP
jgi:polyhydroxybutyrate depolymerase